MIQGVHSGTAGDDRHHRPVFKFGECLLNGRRHPDVSGIGGDGGEGPVEIEGKQGCRIDEIVQGRKSGVTEQIGHGRPSVS